MTSAIIIDGSAGATYELGIVTLRLLAAAETTNGSFALGEFSGKEGPWTVPHVHRHGEESFYILDGRFTFTLGDEDIEAAVGSFLVVPRGMRHLMRAEAGGGRLLALWTPAGPEALFVELSRLPADSLRDPEVREMLSARIDSIPV